MDGIIRAMEMTDIPQILEIEQQSFTKPWTQGMLESELNNPISHNLVIEEAGKITAYIGYWMVLDEIHLLNVAVRKSERGRGLSKFLMHAMVMHGKENDCKTIVLEVRENNTEARGLYRSMRFKDVGRIANYYPEDQQDAIIMRKEL